MSAMSEMIAGEALRFRPDSRASLGAIQGVIRSARWTERPELVGDPHRFS
jgi:hypothetical protein